MVMVIYQVMKILMNWAKCGHAKGDIMRLKRIDFYHSTYSVLCIELNGFYFEYMTFFTSPIKNEFRVYLKNSMVKKF
jgi:hypothetical protein